MKLSAALSDRFIPILTLLLLSTPLSYIGAFFHEEGHGLLALAQGGTFTGIVIGRDVSYALANSYLVSIGGWMGQYVLLLITLGLSWRLRPNSFLAQSTVAMLVLHESIDQPGYMASLQGDSAGTLHLLEAAGIGQGASVALLESIAFLLLGVGMYVSWRVFRTYFSRVFPWLERKRASEASVLFVVLGAVTVFAGFTPIGETGIVSNPFDQALFFAAFLILLSFFAVPPAPLSWKKVRKMSTSYAAFAFALLVFIEAELVYLFVPPITIPFP
jgi:hypothetical protein